MPMPLVTFPGWRSTLGSVEVHPLVPTWLETQCNLNTKHSESIPLLKIFIKLAQKVISNDDIKDEAECKGFLDVEWEEATPHCRP